MPPKKQTFEVVPIPKKIIFLNPFKKPLEENLLGKGWNYPHPPLLNKKKTPFEKEKKVLNLSSPPFF